MIRALEMLAPLRQTSKNTIKERSSMSVFALSGWDRISNAFRRIRDLSCCSMSKEQPRTLRSTCSKKTIGKIVMRPNWVAVWMVHIPTEFSPWLSLSHPPRQRSRLILGWTRNLGSSRKEYLTTMEPGGNGCNGSVSRMATQKPITTSASESERSSHECVDQYDYSILPRSVLVVQFFMTARR